MTPSVPTTQPAPAAAPAEPTHGCVRCGRPVPLDVAMCDQCNPLGLSQPSSTQVHGTVALGIVLFVIVLAVVGRMSLAGVGPFDASLVGVTPSADGLTLTLTVRNDGRSQGTTNCRVTDPARTGGGPSAFVISPLIPAGETVTFQADVRQFGTDPLQLAVQCEQP